ncbi:hypothetical protein MMC26_000288 [Xylographa opegraphella]|nr:hypothetical protein [Xylographa opegraphella]
MATITSYSLLQPHTPFSSWNDVPVSDQENATPRTLLANPSYHRTISASSLGSSGSVIVQPLRVRNENAVPSRTTSLSTLDLHEDCSISTGNRKPNGRVSHKSSWGTDIPLAPIPGQSSNNGIAAETLEDVNPDTENSKPIALKNDNSHAIQNHTVAPRLSFINSKENLLVDLRPKRQVSIKSIGEIKSHPFRRWMSTLHRKSLNRQQTLRSREHRWSLDDFDELLPSDTVLLQSPTSRRHKKSSSWASSGFVTAVKSASMSLATISVAPQSRKAHRSNLLRSSNRSSRFSRSFNRPSMEESSASSTVIDEAAQLRAHKRRKILEELVESEEGYVADLKVLVNVYFTLLATSTAPSHQKLTHIHENITEILVLHEDLLSRLRNTIQVSTTNRVMNNVIARHTRRHSVNTPALTPTKTSTFDVRRSLDVSKHRSSQEARLVSDPKEAANAAMIFGELMSQFFVYEEYGARYETMLCDMTLTSQNIPNWHAYERGIEALANTLAPVNVREGCNRKGLTFGDLLIKPIQRVCKYPLLFADLFKHLPVIDCPESHAEIEKVLFRLRETAMEINKATNDEYARERIQRSWHLQDLLLFPNPIVAPFTLRSLGHAILCGVLHVAYQPKQGVAGQYMLCTLFSSCLILGAPMENGQNYIILASISLADLHIEAMDNGKGLQCHTALYSWKVVFESEQQLFEIIFSACSPSEEQRWKSELVRLSAREFQESFDRPPISHAQFSLLSLELKSIGSILGQPGTLARRISIQRAQTMGPRNNVSQVFIKNTHALKDSIDSSTVGNLAVSRSQSLLSTNRIPVLAPKRLERMRMEHDLAKVWTKELLPYPGMGGNRGEHLFRTSASSMMRKLSRASLASGFTKRSASLGSLTTIKFGGLQESTQEFEDEVYDSVTGAILRAEARDSQSESNRMVDRIDSIGRGSLRQVIPPERTSSRNRARSSKGSKEAKLSSEGEDRDRFTMGRFGTGEKTLRNRWSSPISLIRTLSTEKMKNMFS